MPSASSNPCDLRLLGIVVPECTERASSPAATPRETTSLLDADETAACDNHAQEWHDASACAPPPEPMPECMSCGRLPNLCQSEAEWTEHWAYVLHSARTMAADIERMEADMNRLTERKRMASMLFSVCGAPSSC